jgi:Flp pilus assembly protein TadD
MAAGSPAKARAVYERLLQVDPRHADGHFALALLAADAGDGAVAVKHLRQALDARRQWPAAMIELAWLLAVDPSPDVRNGEEAVELAEAAQRIAPKSPRAWDALGAAYAEAGRFDVAVRAADEALSLGEAQKLDDGELSQMQFRRQLYQMGMRYRAARAQP